MLAVEKKHRGKGIATKLVRMAIDAMIERGADEVFVTSLLFPLLQYRSMRFWIPSYSQSHSQIALETEVINTAAVKLYERLGFLKSKCLHRYYLNGNTAFRFLLYIKEGAIRTGPDDAADDNGQLFPRAA